MRSLLIISLFFSQTIYASSDESSAWERFARLNLGASAFKEQVFATDALKKSIEESLTHIKGVERAVLVYNRGQESVFIAQKRDGNATVMLHLSAGYVLTSAVKEGVQSFVAHSLLIPKESVTILDGDAFVNEGEEYNVVYYRAQKEREFYYTERIQQLLHAMYPEAKVSVSLTLERQSKETQSLQYTPNNVQGALRSERTVIAYHTISTTRNFEVSSQAIHSKNDPWSIRQRHIAVSIPKLLTPQEQREVEVLIRDAAGIHELQGDTLKVVGISGSAFQTADKREWTREDEGMIFWYIVCFIITIMVLRQCKKWLLPEKKKAQPTPKAREQSRSEVVSNLTVDKKDPMPPIVSKTSKPKIPIEDIQKIARENPRLAAEIIKSWMNE